MINKAIEYDSREYRRKNKIKGIRGTDWYKYYDGIPPSDDESDYEWSGLYWNKIWGDDDD